MKLKRFLFIFLCLFSSHTLACDEIALKNCFKFKGGISCYKKHNCDQSLFEKDFCQNFDFEHCLKWKGGSSCLGKKKNCEGTFSSTRNNFEGYIPLITTIPGFGESQMNCKPHGIILMNNVRTTQNFAQRFIDSAHKFAKE